MLLLQFGCKLVGATLHLGSIWQISHSLTPSGGLEYVVLPFLVCIQNSLAIAQWPMFFIHNYSVFSIFVNLSHIIQGVGVKFY